MKCSSATYGFGSSTICLTSLTISAGVVLLALAFTFDATVDAASYVPPNVFKYHRRASMPSLSVVSPLDVLRETQTNRLLADRINANNAFLSRIGKRGNDGAPNFLQYFEEFSQAEEP
ncbi:uncharacterized protein LOC111248063 [Varroa destructor]|uniref:Corticotropin-releasing factor domain-containing protein n=1 Tax=Varroa destructor TaxID=109461 RepID=A0A7M7JQ66_VARDE|nr:uncharacterized protein LOC111248063 [Varroa destructor]